MVILYHYKVEVPFIVLFLLLLLSSNLDNTVIKFFDMLIVSWYPYN